MGQLFGERGAEVPSSHRNRILALNFTRPPPPHSAHAVASLIITSARPLHKRCPYSSLRIYNTMV